MSLAEYLLKISFGELIILIGALTTALVSIIEALLGRQNTLLALVEMIFMAVKHTFEELNGSAMEKVNAFTVFFIAVAAILLVGTYCYKCIGSEISPNRELIVFALGMFIVDAVVMCVCMKFTLPRR